MDIGLITSVTAPTGSWIINIIIWLVSISGSITLGVVLFTFLLKLVTLPFDFVSRKSTRKNSLKMEEMRPELEKLQRQYADNKELYQRKMMALYKKNGYSMFGACLPTIVTLVIFIIALNGFSAYSQYQNRQYFYNMQQSYNSVVYDGFETDNDYIVKNADGTVTINADKIYNDTIKVGNPAINVGTHEIIVEDASVDSNKKMSIKTTNGYIIFTPNYEEINNQVSITISPKAYRIIAEKLPNTLTLDGKTFSQYKLENDGKTEVDFLKEIGRERSAERFRTENEGFLWVKNIWITDSSMKNPVEKNHTAFNSANGAAISEADYNELTFNLTEEKSTPNGYFILVALTALSSLLMQLIMSKSQKAQMELQTVNGQGAQSQKFMTWLMPIMMAVFSFMYTAAFSIYIILSSIISLITTALINYFVDKKFKKERAKKNDDTIRGRVYVPKQEEKPAEPKKKAKKEKPDDFTHGDADFMSGKADKKKHIRGRFK